MRSGSQSTAAKPAPASRRKATPPLLKTIKSCLNDAKAEDVVSIDLNGKAALADTMIVASGRSNRHVSAITDQLSGALKDAGYKSVRIEGLPHCDWVVMDAGDVIVHIFRPEVRTFYNIEKLWSPDAPADTATS
ncbi:MAG: ribosome silencing factor [Anderseniella sp.]